MLQTTPKFETRLAQDETDLSAALSLRYKVFVEEMGADGALVDHDAGLEKDSFDAHAKLMLLFDKARPAGDQVVGVYRLMDAAAARDAGRFYSESEYDLAPLLQSGRPLLELGRSCLHPEYRGGVGMHYLWQAVAAYVEEAGVEILFGVASFSGTNPAALAQPLSLLHDRHLAAPELRVRSRSFQRMDLLAADQIDRIAALKQIPALIKAYLRLGGVVGDGAFVDHSFNTTDVCLVVDTKAMNTRQKLIYSGATA